MARKATNKDRIARMAAEKAAGDKEKKVAKKAPAKKKTTTRKRAPAKKKDTAPKPGIRVKLVWVVCDQAGSPVKTFLYPERKDADKEAARLTEKKGKLHFVKKDRVPMEE